MTAVTAFFLVGQRSGPAVLLSLALAGIGAIWVIFHGDVDALLRFDVGQGEQIYFVGCVAYAVYTPLLPEVDAQFQELDARIRLRLEQQKNVGKRLHAMLTAPRPEYLATAEERTASARLTAIEAQLGESDPQRERVARLRGALTWRLETEYHTRLTEAFEHLTGELHGVIARRPGQAGTRIK
jgi:hypothetical protein